MKSLWVLLFLIGFSATASAERLWKDSVRFRKVSQSEIKSTLLREDARSGSLPATAVAEETKERTAAKLIQSLGPMSKGLEKIVKTLSVSELERLIELRAARRSENNPSSI